MTNIDKATQRDRTVAKDRNAYQYVARRAIKSDEKYLTRNFKDSATFIISKKDKNGYWGKRYLWVENSEKPNSSIVVLESHYVGGRNFHQKGSAIYKACEQAIKRLLAEQDNAKSPRSHMRFDGQDWLCDGCDNESCDCDEFV